MATNSPFVVPTDSRELANAELRRNPLYARFSDEGKEWYIEQSLKLGTETAEQQLERDDNILRLLEEDGVELIRKSGSDVNSPSALRSEIEFKANGSKILIYMDSVRSISENSRKHAPHDLKLQEKGAFEMHVAHEYFHYLEFASGKTTSQRLPRMEIAWLGKLKRRIEVRETCEIAAQAFAMRFCGLSVLPTYYDLLLIETRKNAG